MGGKEKNERVRVDLPASHDMASTKRVVVVGWCSQSGDRKSDWLVYMIIAAVGV